ncbi:MAG: hypothetical protein KDE27_01880 [Planctomycetes bacterium]|nr:hypothetical protein [Planctomycetota bacterium]
MTSTTLIAATLSLASLVALSAPPIELAESSTVIAFADDGQGGVSDTDAQDGCAGCDGGPYVNPLSGADESITIVSAEAGMVFDDMMIEMTNATCSWVPSPLACSPDDNCKFKGKYTITGAPGVHFRNDRLPYACEWSSPAVEGAITEVLKGATEQWIGACDDTVTVMVANFYKEATTCSNGTRIAEVHFAAVCTSCQEIPQ